jgi:hypothetical protein
MNPSSLIKPEV